MTQAIVAVYSTYAEAERVKSELLSAGFSSDDVSISARQAGSGTETSDTSDDGIMGFFRSLFGDDDDDKSVGHYSDAVRRGHAVVTVDADSHEEALRAQAVMDRFNPVDIDQQSSLTGTSTAGQSTHRSGVQGETAIPVIEEEMQVGKRQVERGSVRVFTRVTEKPVQETVRLREEHATVERRPVDRPASEADLAKFREGTIEVRESAEELVVNKQARVVEEVIVGKEVTERAETVTDTVRRTEVKVENSPGKATTTSTHHASHSATPGTGSSTAGIGAGSTAATGTGTKTGVGSDGTPSTGTSTPGVGLDGGTTGAGWAGKDQKPFNK